MSSTRPRPSRIRRVLFGAAAVLLAVLVVEAVALGIHAARFGGLLSMTALQAARDDLRGGESAARPPFGARAPGEQDENNLQALHPFLGYVLDPEQSRTWPVNEFGFLGAAPPFTSGPDAPISVAILGGSVAENMTIFANDTLQRELSRIQAFTGRDIAITCLALRGMKQPQQLLAIDWFLSLGAHFDLVINLDGFNEVVLATENAMQGTFPFYPRRWRARVEGLSGDDLLEQLGKLRFLEARRVATAERFSGALLRHTATGNLTWELLDQRRASAVATARAALNRALLARDADGAPYAARGPETGYASDAARARALADYWRASSVLLAERARAHGFDYFHFLQPNQHVPDSKPFAPEERQVALPGDYFFRDAATLGYRALIEAGGELAADGVAYRDLTQLFADVEEPVYNDPCCHFNTRGYQLIAEAIGRTVREAHDDKN